MSNPFTRRRLALMAAASMACAFVSTRGVRAEGVNWAVDASGEWTSSANWSSAPALPGATSDVTINRPAGDFLITLSSGVHAIASLTTTERVTLAGGTLTVAGAAVAGNTLAFTGGSTLRSATLSTSGAGAVVITNGTFDGVTAHANLDITPANALLTALNTFTLHGTATLGSGSRIAFGGNQTIAGTGTIVLQNQGINAVIVNADSGSLTIGAGITIRGGGANDGLSANIGRSNWYGGGTSLALLNQGVIQADVAGGFMPINPAGGTFTNAGTITASNGGTLRVFNLSGTGNTTVVNNGHLSLGGSLTQAGLGNVVRTGGTISLTGLLTGNLALSAGTGSMLLNGGTLSGGTYSATGGAALSSLIGTLNNATIDGPLQLTAANALATITNNLALKGTVSLGPSSRMVFTGSQSLTGTGTVLFTNEPITALVLPDNGSTLTLGSGVTLRGGGPNAQLSGGIGYSGWFGGGASLVILSQATILAENSGGFMTINPNGGTFTNSGTIGAVNTATLTVFNLAASTGETRVNNGVLNLAGSLTQASLGAMTRSGGTVNLTGLLAGNLALNANTGSFNLVGGTLAGGTLSATGGAAIRLTPPGGVLSGVTANADLSLAADNANVTIAAGLTLNGVMTIGNSARLIAPSSQSIAGAGTIVLGNSAINALLMPTSNTSLTFGPGILLRGGGGNVTLSANVGKSNWFGGGDNLTIINNGTISADVAGTFLTINPAGGTFTNNGTLEARNGGTFVASGLVNTGTISVVNSTFTILAGAWNNTGTLTSTNSVLNLGGAFSQAALGTFIRTAGTVNLTGALAGNLHLNAATGSWNLAGGTLAGGTYTAADGQRLALSPAGGTLNDVTAHAPIDLTAVNAVATVHNTLTLNSTLTLGENARVNFTGNGSLAGSGTVLIENRAINALVLPTSLTSLTIGSGILVRGGGANESLSANIGKSNWHGGGDGLTIINNGTIHSNAVGSWITVNPGGGSFTSNGPLQGPGNFGFGTGVSHIHGPFTTAGTVTLTGGTLALHTPAPVLGRVIGTGAVLVNAGVTLTSDGVIANALSVTGAHAIRPNGGLTGVTRVSTLTIAGAPNAWTGRLDISNNPLMVQGNSSNKASLIATLNSLIESGRNGGAWNGPGITSSTLLATPNTALALVDNAQLQLGSLRGIAVDLNALIVMQARIGDATLDGRVDAFDLNKLAANWQLQSGALWSSGDFTSDGKVDAFDLNALAANWQFGTGGGLESFEAALAALPSFAGAAVPEPASLALLTGGLAMLAMRRRRGRAAS